MTKLRAGDRCPCCGQPITTSSPERLAVLQHLADAIGYERTCGTCPVAVATAHDHLIVCPLCRGPRWRRPPHPGQPLHHGGGGVIKPILFSTPMVQAILRGEKTVTRRLISPQHLRVLESPYHKENPDVEDATLLVKLCLPPYSVGDTLYVREAWAVAYDVAGFPGSVAMAGAPQYVYRADGADGLKWRPSIHMPRSAARIWLRVTAVQPARLHDMTEADVRREGFDSPGDFIRLWDATLRPEARASAGWCANPWVWVISFERLTDGEIRELVLP